MTKVRIARAVVGDIYVASISVPTSGPNVQKNSDELCGLIASSQGEGWELVTLTTVHGIDLNLIHTVVFRAREDA